MTGVKLGERSFQENVEEGGGRGRGEGEKDQGGRGRWGAERECYNQTFEVFEGVY